MKLPEKYRGFDTPWHLGNQWEMVKFPFVEWEWLIQHRRPYSAKSRGEFPVGWVTHYEPGRYDFALLHLDQQCMEESIWLRGKGSLYRDLDSVIKDIPKIVIIHGTPDYPERFQNKQELISKMREAIGENYVVVNSRTAAEQWGFGTPIIHGLDPQEWWDLPKEPRVVTMISPAGLDHYYDRPFLNAVKDVLAEKGIQHCHISVDWIADTFDDYRNFLGRSLIYFNPTRESPMPRSRTEAMFSGCCVITTPHQDADSFIEDGVNGFLVKRDPEQVAQLCEELMNSYDRAVAIGQRGKETAMRLFHKDRFESEWRVFIEATIKDFKNKKP